MLVCIVVGALRPTGLLEPGAATLAEAEPAPGNPGMGSPSLLAKSSGAPSRHPTRLSTTHRPQSTPPSVAHPVFIPRKVVGVSGPLSTPTPASITTHLPPLDASNPKRLNWAVDAGDSMESPITLRVRNAPALPPHSSSFSLGQEPAANPVAPPTAGMLGGQIKGRDSTQVARGLHSHGMPPGNRPLGIRRPAGVQKPTSALLEGRGGYTLTVCAHVCILT